MPGMDSANSRWLQSQLRLAEIQRSWQRRRSFEFRNGAVGYKQTSIHIRSLGTLILQDDENMFLRQTRDLRQVHVPLEYMSASSAGDPRNFTILCATHTRSKVDSRLPQSTKQ